MAEHPEGTETRVILPCAGPSKRWGNFLGVPKHLIPFNGIPMLQRTVNQLRFRAFRDIIVVAYDGRYHMDGARMCAPITPSPFPDTGLGHSSEFWSPASRTLVLFGDVFFSEAAMETIATCPATGIQWFGREGPGRSGHKHGELFGVSIPPNEQKRMRRTMWKVRWLRRLRWIHRARGWECYRLLHRLPLKEHRIAGDFIEIDDATEDFDFPYEYLLWMKVFAAKFGFQLLEAAADL